MTITRRPVLSTEEYLGLLRDVLADKHVPFYSEYTPGEGGLRSPVEELLTDAWLAHHNEVHALRGQLEVAEQYGSRARRAVDRLWKLVYANGKRITMRTADVLAALDDKP